MSVSDNVVTLSVENTPRKRALLARLPAPIHAVRERAHRELSDLLCKLFDQADDALFKLADQANNNETQNLYFESMRELRIQRRLMEQAFFASVDDAFSLLLKPKVGESATPLVSHEISVDNLSLINNDELEELVAIDSMVLRANKEYAGPIEHLSYRLNGLVAADVKGPVNPLSPSVLCGAFSASSDGLCLDIRAKLVLFKLFGKHVMNALGPFYKALNQLLIEQNVQPNLIADRQRVRKSQANPRSRQGSNNMPDREVAYDVELKEEVAHLSSTMVNGTSVDLGALLAANPAVSGFGAGGFAPTPTILSALNGIQRQATAEDGRVDVGALLSQYLQAQAQPSTIRQADTDVIDLLNLLFDYILEDSNLASPMKVQIGRLQVPLLKVALSDKTFFSQGGHPARRLLNEMASLALGWHESDLGSAVPLDKITGVVNQVLEGYEDDATIFVDLLADLVSFSEKEKRRTAILEQRILDAESGKAKAEGARSAVDAALEGIINGASLPEGVHSLMTEAWGNVLLLIHLKHGEGDDAWTEGLETARDLIWSVSDGMGSDGRSRLLKMLPGLLKRLRHGLESISYNPFEMQNLLQQLEKSHLAQLTAKSAPKQSPKKVPAKPASQEKTAVPGVEDSPSVGVEPFPLTAAMVDEAPDLPLSNNAIAPLEQTSDTQSDDYYLGQVDKLTQGTWFEMVEEGKQGFRCRLAAIIKKSGKYIFVNRSGSKVAEETRDSLALALEHGSLNQLDDGMLFDRALESVIGNLRSGRSSVG